MAYKSPFHFLPPDTVTTPVDPMVIQRAKKKLLAEFEVDDKGVAGFSKNDLLQWFDNLKPEELQFHKYIYNNKTLLEFLEHGKVTPGDWHTGIPDDASLQHFVLSRVQQQYDHLFAEAFRAADNKRIKELSRFSLPDIEKKGRYYYTGTLNLLTSYYHQLLQLTREWNAAREPQVREFISLPFLFILPALPPYFQAMRDEFSVTIIRFAAELCDDKFKQRAFAQELANVSRTLAPSASALSTIESLEKEKIFNEKSESATSSSSTSEGSSKKGCVTVVIVIFVLITLLRILLSALG
jgi:hypothetical protein